MTPMRIPPDVQHGFCQELLAKLPGLQGDLLLEK